MRPHPKTCGLKCSKALWIWPHAFLSRSEEHTSELQSRLHLVCRLLLEKKNKAKKYLHGSSLVHPFYPALIELTVGALSFAMICQPPKLTLFPYTTLFRSRDARDRPFDRRDYSCARIRRRAD